jgi:hypothetical protein
VSIGDSRTVLDLDEIDWIGGLSLQSLFAIFCIFCAIAPLLVMPANQHGIPTWNSLSYHLTLTVETGQTAEELHKRSGHERHATCKIPS